MNIQVRLGKLGSSVSVVDRVAFELGKHRVEIEPVAAKLRVDGTPVTLANGNMLDFADGARIVRSGSAYAVTWPGAGDRPALWADGRLIKYYVPPDLAPRGLLGDADGNPSNDLMLDDGTRLPETASASAIHGTLADSWRSTDEESLFGYESGQSTGTFTDRTFPGTVISLGDFSDDALAEATAHCQAANVNDGHTFENCLLDWAVTREQTFVDAAADDDVPSIEPGARRVDANGVVTEDFESSIAPNFSALRYGSGAGSGRFAGPFGRDGRYSASVSLLPGHESATVQFDLVALGSWPNDNSSPVTISVDGRTAWSGSLASRTPSSQGTTPSGQAYAVYPMSVTVPHSAEELGLGVSAAIAVGAQRAFAIDNVRASLELVAPETFDVSLPLHVPRTSLPGAGSLETTGSEDRYRFTLSSATDVQVDLSSCSRAVTWAMTDVSGGETVAAGACGSKRTPVLDDGEYQLAFVSRGEIATYQLAVAEVPDPDRFGIALPVVAANDFPGAGAGRLETTASEDHYEFTTQVTSGVVIDLSSCSAGLGTVRWRLVDADSGIVLGQGDSCWSNLVPNVKPGRLRVEISGNGRSGTYTVSLEAQPTPQVFNVSLPAAIEDGSPAGAGKLETTASEDVYAFETTGTSGLAVDVSSCSPSLERVDWKLTNEAGATVQSASGTCGGALVPDLPAGQYRLSVTHKGFKGTYKLQLHQAQRQDFNITLPATIQDGSPAGAGNLETSGSEDAYSFTTNAPGGLQIDLSDCSAGRVAWKLTNGAGATVQASDASYGTCASEAVPNVPSGQYTLSVKAATSYQGPGTYRLGVLSTPAPQTFQVTPPASIANGTPAAGTGNLETTASEDRYEFTTTATTTVRAEFSECAATLGTVAYGAWSLVRVSTGTAVASGTWTCGSEYPEARDVPAGSYQFRVTRNGAKGIYRLRLLAQAAQQFNVSLPASISDGSPQPGAGRLESSAAEDVYAFTTTTAGALQIDASSCASSLGGLAWTLLDAADAVVASDHYYGACSGRLVPELPAGSYRVRVSSPEGGTGAYALALYAQPAAQTFQVTPPVSISDGSPSAGAGNLETTASEDRYQFTTAAAGMVQMTFSNCTDSLASYGLGAWKLVRMSSGETIKSGSWDCAFANAPAAENLAGGTYQLRVTRNGAKGTYKLALLAETPQSFAVTLPASISDGTPATGAGNLESAASEDAYTFQTSIAGDLVVDLSDCASSLTTLRWTLANGAGDIVASGDSCAGELVRNLPSGSYRLAVSAPGHAGTYRLDLVSPPPPQTFAVTLPASIADGSPAAGAGNLETSVSEDRYTFRTTTDGHLQLSFSDCATTLDNELAYKLIRTATGSIVASGSSPCSETRLSDLPAGSYELRITGTGGKGTYKLALAGAEQQRFTVSLPATISDGTPNTGAGNLETTASEDVYTFDTDAAGGLEVNASSCSASLGTVEWRLLDEDGVLQWSNDGTCSNDLVPSLPAGRYTLFVSHPGRTGTYRLSVVSQAPQTFNVAMPAAISDGAPEPGAGNIETTASQDRYRFTIPADGKVQIRFSQCSSSLNSIDWRLYHADGHLASPGSSGCGMWTFNTLWEGTYILEVAGQGRTGTYHLDLVHAVPQTFNVTSPASISDGVPSAGAGNIETIASEDRYRFTLARAGNVRLGFSQCSSSLYGVFWKLVKTSNEQTVSQRSVSECTTRDIPDVPAGTYEVRVSNWASTGTYKLQLLAESPQQFDVSVPASISNGSPTSGAGNLETAVSEDVYAFDISMLDRLKLAFSECSAPTKVNWKLLRSDDTVVASQNQACGSTIVPDVAPGPYKLKVTGDAGTYKLQLSVPIPPQLFNVTLPVSISSDSPAAGAGNLETADSEDRYQFTTTSQKSIQLYFSECAGLPALTTVTWTLVNAQTTQRISGVTAGNCATTTVSAVPAGTYEVRVSAVAPINSALDPLATRTYKLNLSAS